MPRPEKRRKNSAEAGVEPTTSWSAGRHADHSATVPRWRRKEIYAKRTKLCSFLDGTKSPHRIFAAALTKAPTAPWLHRGESKVLSVHCIDSQTAPPPFDYDQGNDFSGPPRRWVPDQPDRYWPAQWAPHRSVGIKIFLDHVLRLRQWSTPPNTADECLLGGRVVSVAT